MMRSLWSAATGMIAQQLNVDTIANNLANVNTAGYKKMRVDFQDLMYQTLRMPGSPSTQSVQLPTGLQVGLGTKAAATVKNFEQGTFEQTGNKLDLVIEGNGFFQVTLPSGQVAYTRAGAFKMDADGNVVTSDGYLLEPPIAIPSDATDISVMNDGTVAVMSPGSTEPKTVGTIQLAVFPNPAGLSNLGHNLYTATAASGAAKTANPGLEGTGTISQGVLELSNVQVVEEMVNMIVAQRAYEASSQAIKTADRMLETANNVQR
ncbi:flagellar basal-body rod protein FlgG [bacterium]|nr:flagellar basal-body rod protein FlgG [bacterium]